MYVARGNESPCVGKTRKCKTKVDRGCYIGPLAVPYGLSVIDAGRSLTPASHPLLFSS